MKKVIITVDGSGRTNVDAEGFLNNECKKHTKPYQDSMGGGAVAEDKPEARIPAPVGTVSAGAGR